MNKWNAKISAQHYPFSLDFYNFYMKICLENQIYNFIQRDHYIDNGCLCNYCSQKRQEIFVNAKNGLQIHDKIIHNEVVNNHINTVKTTVVNNFIKNVKQIHENRQKFLNKIKNSNNSIIRKNIMNNKSNKLQNSILNSLIKPQR